MILGNNNEPSISRYLAASNIGRIGSESAKVILTKRLQSEVDEQVFVAIVTALERIGDKNSLDLILQKKGRMKVFAASQAKFAASLISYRLGLEGNDLVFPGEQDFLKISTDAIPMQISEATDEEVKACRLSLVQEQFGIELADRPAFQIKYDQGVMLFNQEFVDEQGSHSIL